MGNATPYERIHLRIPVLKAPDQMDPYPTTSSGPSTNPVPEIDPDTLARLRYDPWALRKVDPKDRENPEVLKLVMASGHPQALEAISFFVPPEVLHRPEIYSWLKDYRDGALPNRIIFFQASVGLGADAAGGALTVGGEFGFGGPRFAGTIFYDRFSPSFDQERSTARHLLGLKPLVLAYPAKRISMRENQSILSIEAPLGWIWEEGNREILLGAGVAYASARGDEMALPVWGFEAKALLDPLDGKAWLASVEAQIPFWSMAAGVEFLARRKRH